MHHGGEKYAENDRIVEWIITLTQRMITWLTGTLFAGLRFDLLGYASLTGR